MKNAPGSLPDEIISFSVISLMGKIITECCLQVSPPDRLLKPEALQRFLESLSPALGMQYHHVSLLESSFFRQPIVLSSFFS
jgi:hypothetical protein